jgi:plastocyanin
MHINHASSISAFATVLLVAACSGGGASGSTGTSGPTSVASITVSSSSSNLTTGTTMTMTATPKDANGGTLTSTVTWATSNENVAYIKPSTGIAYGISPGSVTLSATSGAISGSKAITVAAPSGTATTAYVLASTGTAFFPTNITIAQGGTVTFVFGATTHNVFYSNVTGRPANIGDSTNQDVTSTFTTKGTFPISCGLHVGMVGTITVI